MAKLKAAWIGYMDPEHIQNGGDPFVYYEKYAKIGFKAMDGDIGRLPGNRDENFKRFTDLGLKCLSSGSPNMHELVGQPDEIKRIAENCHYYRFLCGRAERCC